VKGWLRKSINANRKAIELNPNNEQAIGNLGWCYFNRGELDKALPLWKRELLLAPQFPFAFIQMGWIYMGLDDYVEAEKWLNNASELQPHNFNVNNGLITCYLAQGKYQQAIERSQKWLIMVPNNPRVLSNAGFVELFSGNFERAQLYYQNSINIYSSRGNLIGLGYIYWKKEQLDEARKLLNQALDLCQKQLEQGSERPLVPYDIAAINAIRGNKEEAYKWLKKAIDAGWREFRLGQRNPFLENLREDEQFKQMMSRVKAMVDEMRKRVEKES
jgi:tetratricopeptide (TPR) repeat protein